MSCANLRIVHVSQRHISLSHSVYPFSTDLPFFILPPSSITISPPTLHLFLSHASILDQEDRSSRTRRGYQRARIGDQRRDSIQDLQSHGLVFTIQQCRSVLKASIRWVVNLIAFLISQTMISG